MDVKGMIGLCAVLAMVRFANGQPAEMRIQASVPKDNRSPGNLVVELDLSGKDVIGTEGVRCILDKAVDDTGKNLILKQAEWDYTSSNQNLTPVVTNDPEIPPGMQLILDLPSKQATNVKEISGVMELFKPANDPLSVITVTNIAGQTNMDLSHPSLLNAQIKMTVFKKENNGKPGVGVRVSDPLSKLFYFKFLDANGKEWEVPSTVVTAASVSSHEFREPLPNGAKLLVCVPTPKSLIKAPIAMKDIALPKR